MNYLIHRRIFMLAAEYVLGTLKGKARVRFLKLMLLYPPIRPYVWFWERWLINLAIQDEQIKPSDSLKNRVFTRLGLSTEHT